MKDWVVPKARVSENLCVGTMEAHKLRWPELIGSELVRVL